jgi:hypothetical protein
MARQRNFNFGHTVFEIFPRSRVGQVVPHFLHFAIFISKRKDLVVFPTEIA